MQRALQSVESSVARSAVLAARSGRWSAQCAVQPYFRVLGPYEGEEPAFYDPRAFFWVPLLQQAWREVRAEFEQYAAQHGEIPGHFVPDRVEIHGWKGVKLVTFGRPYRANLRAFPRTVAVLQAVPGLVSASINVLEPGTVLPVHHGDSDLCYRVHVGLIVPAGVEQCGIRVGDEQRGWEEGGVLVFNDARPHTVWNRSSKPRVILLCDVLKPQYARTPVRACAQVLATIALLYVQLRLPGSERLPAAVWRSAVRMAAAPFAAYLRLCGWVPRPA